MRNAMTVKLPYPSVRLDRGAGETRSRDPRVHNKCLTRRAGEDDRDAQPAPGQCLTSQLAGIHTGCGGS